MPGLFSGLCLRDPHGVQVALALRSHRQWKVLESSMGLLQKRNSGQARLAPGLLADE